ncbi:hypothetical protein ACXYUI_28900, partial [Klebsiella pneumoniae]
CKSVLFVPTMPGESTGHIDMVAKFVDDDTVFVSAISDEQIAATNAPEEKIQAKKDQDYLVDLKARLAQAGFSVVTIPLPVPQLRYFGT